MDQWIFGSILRYKTLKNIVTGNYAGIAGNYAGMTGNYAGIGVQKKMFFWQTMKMLSSIVLFILFGTK